MTHDRKVGRCYLSATMSADSNPLYCIFCTVRCSGVYAAALHSFNKKKCKKGYTEATADSILHLRAVWGVVTLNTVRREEGLSF